MIKISVPYHLLTPLPDRFTCLSLPPYNSVTLFLFERETLYLTRHGTGLDGETIDATIQNTHPPSPIKKLQVIGTSKSNGLEEL